MSSWVVLMMVMFVFAWIGIDWSMVCKISWLALRSFPFEVWD